MRTLIAILIVVSGIFTFEGRAQTRPAAGLARDTIVADPNIQPAESQSRLEIFVDGAWQTDLDGRFDPARPTVVLIHGWQMGNIDKDGHLKSDSITDYWLSATTALQTRVPNAADEGDINLLGWNWLAKASTYLLELPAVVPSEYTYNEGMLLSKALQALQPEGKLHIVGHSLGAKVAGVAALYCPSLPIDQVTLFDAPENLTSDTLLKEVLDTAPVYLHDDIRQLLARQIFVDSYSSAFGTNYQECGIPCIDLNMKPPISLTGVIQTAAEAHRYPINWYFGGNSGTLGSPAGTIDPATGQIAHPFGAAWSKVLNRTDSEETIDTNRTTYTVGPNPDTPIEGLQFELFARPSVPYTLIPVSSRRPEKTSTVSKLPLSTGTPKWFRQGNVVFDDTQAVLTTESPVFLFANSVIPEGLVTLSFDFQLDAPLPDDKLTVFMNDKLLWSFDGQAFPDTTETFLTTNLIDITEFAGQTTTLTMCYASRKAGQIARITHIQLISKSRLPFYELKTEASGKGYVFPHYRSCEKNTVVSLIAVPQDGYEVLAWDGTGSFRPREITNSVTMTGKKKIDVFFIPDEYAACFFTSLGLPLILVGGFSLLGVKL